MAQPNHTLKLLNGNYKEELQRLIDRGIHADCVVTRFDISKLPTSFDIDTIIDLFDMLAQCTWKGTHLYIEVPDRFVNLIKDAIEQSNNYVLKNTLQVVTDEFLNRKFSCNLHSFVDLGCKTVLFATNGCLSRAFQEVETEADRGICERIKKAKCGFYYLSNWGLWFKKPELDSFAMMMKLSTKHGDTILDPFMGDGKIGSAAILADRHYIGIESDGALYRKVATMLDNQGE